MLIKEYYIILREVWYKCKGPINFDKIIIKERNQEYIKSFKFSNYFKNNVFSSNYFINFIYIITLYFFFKMLYDFFLFLWYTIDLLITCFFKWFFYIIYTSLDKWETYIFKRMYEVRKDPVKSKLYKREKGLIAKSRAKFFKQFIGPLVKDFDVALQLDKRKHSVILKYYKYFSIWIPSLYRAIRAIIRSNIRNIIWRIRKIKIKSYYRENIKPYRWLYIKLYSLIILKNLINICIIIYKYISIKAIKRPFLFFYRKFSIFYKAYKMRKEYRLKYYTFLYVNYFYFYKKRSKLEDFFSTLSEKDFNKYTDEAMLLTFNIYSFNFKFIYFWHFYIKRIPYLSYLENRYKQKDLYNYTNAMDYAHSNIFIAFNIVWFFEFWCRIFPIIIPIFDKYYVKYVTIILKYSKRIFYYIISFIAYVVTFPFILIAYCYKGLKGFLKYFIIFLKELFK